MFDINTAITKFLSNLPLYGVIGLTAMTSGVASLKLLNNDANALAGNGNVAQISSQDHTGGILGQSDDKNSTDNVTAENSINDSNISGDTVVSENDYYPVATSPNKPSVNVSTNTTLPGATFTLATLALHNKAGDCYVAYNGVVYDVSNHPSWQNCNHHGIVGGIDITSRFPHSTSYFNTLPKKGTLVGGQQSGGTGTGTGSTSSGNDGDDDNKDEHTEQRDSREQNEDSKDSAEKERERIKDLNDIENDY